MATLLDGRCGSTPAPPYLPACKPRVKYTMRTPANSVTTPTKTRKGPLLELDFAAGLGPGFEPLSRDSTSSSSGLAGDRCLMSSVVVVVFPRRIATFDEAAPSTTTINHTRSRRAPLPVTNSLSGIRLLEFVGSSGDSVRSHADAACTLADHTTHNHGDEAGTLEMLRGFVG